MLLMPPRRSRKRGNEPPEPEAHPEPGGKRRRKLTQPFEAGVNPPITPRTRLPSPPPSATHPSRSRNSAPSTPAASQNQPLFVSEDEVEGHEDSDDGGEDAEADPNPEVVDDAAFAGDGGLVEDAAGAAEVVEDAAEELAGAFLEDEHVVVATVRYRASFTDVEKSTIADASYSVADFKVDDLLMVDVWDDWVDETVKNLLPQAVSIASLTAVVYPNKSKVVDRLPQRLRRSNYLDLDALKKLAASVDRNTSEKLCVDFNLILTKHVEPVQVSQPVSQPASQPPRSSQPRARTATIIQEDGLLGVVAAEQMAAGPALVIKDQWRCEDRDCRNYPYVCWLPRTGQPNRWENHYPVNANIIAMWAKAISERQCTVQEPNDRIRVAIMRARERGEIERVRRRQGSCNYSSSGGGCGGGGVLDEVRELQKSVLMAQLQQLNGAAVLSAGRQSSSNWQPFEYEFWGEIWQHTQNFLKYFRQHWDVKGADAAVTKLENEVVRDGHIDINMLMDDSENGVPMTLWVEHYELPPGFLLQLRRQAHRWRKTYPGLTEDDFDKIQEYRQLRRDQNRRNTASSSPREVLGEL